MRRMRWMGWLALLAWPVMAGAQVPPAPGGDIVVEGQRARPSNWREAETQHVIVLSDGPEREVTQIAYHRSFAEAGDTAPAIAVDGLAKALTVVPNAPATRLALGTALAARGAPTARAVLLPVARGGYDSPERVKAEAVLDTLDAR